MMNGNNISTTKREGFFLEFGKAIRELFPSLPLLITGGFRSRLGMENAVSRGDCDMIGVARPAVIQPHLPRQTILNPNVSTHEATIGLKRAAPAGLLRLLPPKVAGGGAETVRASVFTVIILGCADTNLEILRCANS
jgi:hypothetical protein